MAKRTDGGPAFPQWPAAKHGGMTLRDYFAAQLLPFACMREPTGYQWAERCAACAYEFADAMLAEREVERSLV